MVALKEPGSRGTVYLQHDPLKESSPSSVHLFLGLNHCPAPTAQGVVGANFDESSGDGSTNTSQVALSSSLTFLFPFITNIFMSTSLLDIGLLDSYSLINQIINYSQKY